MSERINPRVLQSQTGHKTTAMLDHYKNHSLESDIIKIEAAQLEMFGEIVKRTKV